MRCAACGSENAPGVTRCFACGQRLSETVLQSVARWSLRGPAHAAERLALSDEMLDRAREDGDAERELWVRLERVADRAQLGELAGLAAELEPCERAAEKLGAPYYAGRVVLAHAMPLLALGQFAEGERLSARGRELLEEAGDPAARRLGVLQLFGVRRAQDRLGELEDDVAACAQGSEGPWPILLAIVRDARAELGPLIRAARDRLSGDDLLLVAALAEASHLAGEVPAPQLDELLRPHAGGNLVLGGCAFWGPVDRLRGLVSADPAVELGAALELAQRTGARLWAALAGRDLTAALMDSADRDRRRRAGNVLEDALEAALDLGLAGVGKELIGLKLAPRGGGAPAHGSTVVTLYRAVERESSRLPASRAADRVVTVAFSDIEGSTALNEQLGDRAWMDLLRAHDRLVRGQVAAHRGSVVKSVGDGFMVVFDEAGAAVACALAVQRGSELRVRIGIHTGPAIEDGGDYFGRTVNLAARIADAAGGGEVLVSGDVRELIAERSFAFDDARELTLKGLTGTHLVHRVSAPR